MRHIVVRRLALLLGAIFFLWAGVFAWIVHREPTADQPSAPTTTATGAALFERHCASCHGVEQLQETVGGVRDPSEREKLARFLSEHGDATREEDRQILDYLASLLAQ